MKIIVIFLSIFLSTTSMTMSQYLSNSDSRSYLKYKLPQISNMAWDNFSKAVLTTGSPEEIAAIKRVKFHFDDESVNLDGAYTTCKKDDLCEISINSGIVMFAGLYAEAFAASLVLNSPAGLATECYNAQVDRLQKAIKDKNTQDQYIPILPCLGSSEQKITDLVKDSNFNDIVDNAYLEEEYFIFAHELSHIINGDLDGQRSVANIKASEAKADIDGAQLLSKFDIDPFFGAADVSFFNIIDRSDRISSEEYPSNVCRSLYLMEFSREYLSYIDRAKFGYASTKDLEFVKKLDVYKLREAQAFVTAHSASFNRESCPWYLTQDN